MNFLSADNISHSFGDKWLFRNITFGLNKGDKVALIGTNGTGKTTFMNILTGKLPPDEGSVSLRKGIRLGYLDQSPAFNEDLPVMEVIFSSDNPVASVVQRYEHALNIGDDQALSDSLEEMDNLKAWDFESKAKEVLGRLGIMDTEQPIRNLSGGQRKRVALAKVLLEEPELLILDEPTNHLDLDTVEWLESYLNTQNMTLLVVTHDRYFLDKVCNLVVELDGGSLFSYKGNYAYFLEKKAEREANESTEIDKARNLMRKELEWIRRQPKARGTKAKYRVDAFEDLKDKASQKKFDNDMEMNIKSTRLGSKIIELDSVGKRYGDKELVHNFLYTFKRGDRIGIVGKNGMGKTTLLKMITGEVRPDNGSVVRGDTVQFGYYTQSDLEYQPGTRVSDLVKERAEVVRLGTGQTVTASQYMQSFLFPPNKQHDLVEKLSGGEKRRLQLMLMLMNEPNFLILDEPTNDLDISSLNVLEEFLLNFKGCLLIVSHDRYFLDRLVDHIFLFEGEGKIKDFPGNYTDLREWQAEEGSQTTPSGKTAEIVKPATLQQEPKKAPAKKLSYKEQKEIEQLEKEMETMETKKNLLIEKLNAGGDHVELSAWAKEIDNLTTLMSEKEMRWLELSENA